MRYFLILLAVLCASCGMAIPTVKPYKIDVQQGNVVTSKMLLQLRPGMTKSQVRFIMGTPLIQDSFHGNRWDYAYQMREHGKVTEQRRVILDFDADTLKTVRGDVMPKSTDQTEVSANAGVRAIDPSAKPKEKSTLEKLQFWKNDKAAAVAKAPVAAAVVAEKVVELAAVPLKNEAPEQALVDDAQKSVLAQDVPLPVEADNVSTPPLAPAQEEAAEKSTKVDAGATLDASKTDEVVMQAVNEWASAWRTKKLNEYLGFYSAKFKPEGGMSKKAWTAQRKLRLSGKSGDINLSLADFQVQVNGDKASAQFFQKYSSKIYHDEVSKVLNLEFDHKLNRWLIVKESVGSNAKKLDANKTLKPEIANENIDSADEKVGF